MSDFPVDDGRLQAIASAGLLACPSCGIDWPIQAEWSGTVVPQILETESGEIEYGFIDCEFFDWGAEVITCSECWFAARRIEAFIRGRASADELAAAQHPVSGAARLIGRAARAALNRADGGGEHGGLPYWLADKVARLREPRANEHLLAALATLLAKLREPSPGDVLHLQIVLDCDPAAALAWLRETQKALQQAAGQALAPAQLIDVTGRVRLLERAWAVHAAPERFPPGVSV